MRRYAGIMWLEQVKSYLFPPADKRNPAFRYEIDRSSLQGLQIIGGVQIAISLFMLAASFLVAPGGETLPRAPNRRH